MKFVLNHIGNVIALWIPLLNTVFNVAVWGDKRVLWANRSASLNFYLCKSNWETFNSLTIFDSTTAHALLWTKKEGNNAMYKKFHLRMRMVRLLLQCNYWYKRDKDERRAWESNKWVTWARSQHWSIGPINNQYVILKAKPPNIKIYIIVNMIENGSGVTNVPLMLYKKMKDHGYKIPWDRPKIMTAYVVKDILNERARTRKLREPDSFCRH